jgi:hypothetical protein
VLVYKDTTHSFGGATDTGVAKVTIFMDVSSATGDARDQTGMDMGGGGGIDGDAKAKSRSNHPVAIT